MGDRRTDILQSPVFLLSLVVLLLNDWYLKQEFHNGITGKLSDVAGLAMIFLFLYAWYPKHAKTLIFVIVLSFTYWKSAFSQGAIDLWNSLETVRVSRTIDYSDMYALLVLPLVWVYAHDKLPVRANPVWKSFTTVVCLFAIIGTTAPPTKEEIEELQKISALYTDLVSVYNIKAEHMDSSVRRRLQTLISTFPDQEFLSRRAVKLTFTKDKRVVQAFNYDFDEFYINTWLYHEKPKTLTEYSILFKENCVRAYLRDKSKIIEPFLSALIKFRRIDDSIHLKMIKLEYCDFPNKKNKEQAVDDFMRRYIKVIEDKFYSINFKN